MLTVHTWNDVYSKFVFVLYVPGRLAGWMLVLHPVHAVPNPAALIDLHLVMLLDLSISSSSSQT
jgi:hypothetical protein